MYFAQNAENGNGRGMQDIAEDLLAGLRQMKGFEKAVRIFRTDSFEERKSEIKAMGFTAFNSTPDCRDRSELTKKFVA